MNRPIVVQSEDLADEPARWLAERCDLVRARYDSGAEFDRALARAQGLVIRTYTRVDRALLDKARNLAVVGRAGVGLDAVDVPACRERGVQVVYTPDANTTAVVEYVFALIFDAIRPRLFLERPMESAEWSRVRTELCAPRQLSECTLGILGLGRIGSCVARAAAGFGCRVIYSDIREIPAHERHGATPVSFGALMRESDVISVHVDGRASNRGLVNAQALVGARPHAVIINAARGMVVDTPALAAFLRANPGACALLDVHDPEPVTADCPLLALPNAHLAPHLAASTCAAHRAMGWVVRDMWRVLSGEAPEFPAP